MANNIDAPILLIGGSGVVGSITATILRRMYRDLPIAIGGRDIAKAEAVASGIDGAVAVQVNLERPDLGLSPDRRFSALALFVKDDWLHAAAEAQARRIPYLSISSGAFEIAPEVALHIRNPGAAAMMLSSQWLAGAAVLPALHAARDYAAIDSIRVTALLDERDMGGPAAYADYERITGHAPFAMIRHDGDYFWVGGELAESTLVDSAGREVPAQAYSPLDSVSLAAATGAASVRLDLAIGETPARRAGDHHSTEIGIEIAGTGKDGVPRRSVHRIVHPAGQAPLTALFVALGLEGLLGLASGTPATPGLYLPERLIDPEDAVRRLAEFGADFSQVAA
ncbi:NAD(P)-dependent oxidoreductase [Rhizorhabdus wittichii]|uniref:NAD(P)-dependent oxidoreductase n=1 Tax=Rhizorhabdus wittichii TaxID=160791 RepID=A0A975HDR0_9SPHN|nr:NAD(P)-dependent oxidoreductase [Rhizorhabdus wittichii]QTH21676.1 NAD(P)-dependent oxidoreductase [Rhizorhabdus wittichii]